MDLALNNLQGLIFHKPKQPNQCLEPFNCMQIKLLDRNT